MSTAAAAILGAWIFAAVTVYTKNVAGWFVLVSFVTAIIITIAVLKCPTFPN